MNQETASHGPQPLADACKGHIEPGQTVVIELAGTIMARDYRQEKARTLQTLGLGQYNPGRLMDLL